MFERLSDDWLPTPATSVLDAAVAYTENFWPVIRVYGVHDDGVCRCPAGASCGTPGKHPIGTKWGEASAKTVDEARDIFRHHRGNIGIPIPRHMVCIDIDDEETVKDWPFPETLTAYSGSGRGRHLLYILGSNQAPPKNRKIAHGVDCKTFGGQIVVSPSRHTTGGTYRWGPLVPIAHIPDWLYEKCTASKPAPPMRVITGGKSRGYVSATVNGVCRDIAGAPDGERNNTLFAKATHAFEVILSHGQDPENHMDDLANAAREAGLGEEEIEKTLSSSLATAQHSPSSAPAAAKSSLVRMRIPSMPPPPLSSDASDDWRRQMSVDEDGAPRKTYRNTAIILRHDTDIAWNEMTETPEWNGLALTDARLGEIREQVFANRHGMNVSLEMMWQAVVHVSNERSFHPVRQYLRTLSWDGKPWIGRILHHILGHAEPSEHDQAMLRAWLISAVARVFQPGCKADAILVLCGPQGYFKSSFFDALANPWFSDTLMTPDKDGAQRLRRTWITELAEIDQLTAGHDAGKIKAFITTRIDILRRSYGRVNEALDRHSVFGGTTNELKFLTSETGTRRFWTIEVTTPVRRDLASEWRDQIWAEAMTAYQAGEPWWLSQENESERAAAAEQFVTSDPWEAAIAEWLLPLVDEPVTTIQVANTCLGVETGSLDMKLSKRIGKVMRHLGRTYRTVRTGQKTFKAWVP